MSSTLPLPSPDRLPAGRQELATALRAADVASWIRPAFAAHVSRTLVRQRMTRLLNQPADALPTAEATQLHRLPPPSPAAQAEQLEHDRYFRVKRVDGDSGVAFGAGLVLAYLSAYENCLAMGLTLLDESDWVLLFGGLDALIAVADGTDARDARGNARVAFPTSLPRHWRDDGYDPPARWLIGHQLFFALIQGAIVGLNCFASARTDGPAEEAEIGLTLAAAYLRSSAVAMKFTSDFAPEDYEATVRPAMAPPAVRAGFSGLQTRDHAHLVRLLAALKPTFGTGEPVAAHGEFVEALVAAYAAHEFICARFRGDVLPSLRMAAGSNGRTQRSGVEVIREMMRKRLALTEPPTIDTVTVGRLPHAGSTGS
jgi:hypothetical protein